MFTKSSLSNDVLTKAALL